MVSLSWRDVTRYRAALLAAHRVRTKRAALAFVDRVGFCYAFTGGPGGLPGLFDVLATRSIDRKWEWAWQWKDDLASDKKLFYGKVIRRKPTYVSLRYVPYFYALTGNVGAHDDHLQAYREGRLSLLAKDIYEYLRAHGTCSTWTLRRQFVTRGGVGAAFHRALADLQNHLLIGKVAESEGGTYSFIWDTFDRWLPQSIRTAARITGAQRLRTSWRAIFKQQERSRSPRSLGCLTGRRHWWPKRSVHSLRRSCAYPSMGRSRSPTWTRSPAVSLTEAHGDDDPPDLPRGHGRLLCGNRTTAPTLSAWQAGRRRRVGEPPQPRRGVDGVI